MGFWRVENLRRGLSGRYAGLHADWVGGGGGGEAEGRWWRLCLSLEQGKRREVSVVVNRVVGRISRFVWVKECPEGFM